MSKTQNNFSQGATYFWQGLGLVFKPNYRLFIIFPLLINSLILGTLTYFSFDWFNSWLDTFTNILPSWLSFLDSVIWLLFFVIWLFVLAYGFTILGNLITAPFNSLLAEKVLKLHKQNYTPDSRNILQIILQSLAREFRKMLYYIPRVILLFIISFIPIINTVSPLLWFLFGAWMMTIQYCDYAADAEVVSFQELQNHLKQHRQSALGFGSLVMAGMLLPILNLIIIPAAVIGSSLMWLEQKNSKMA